MSALVDTSLEARVLGHAIVHPEWLAESGLRDEHFTLGAHRNALAAMRRVLAAGDRLDTLTLRGALLAEHGKVDEAWLLDLTADISYSPVEDARRLQELSYLRSVGDHARRLQAASEAGSRAAIAKSVADLTAATDFEPDRVTEYSAADMMAELARVFADESERRVWPGCEVVERLVGDLFAGHMLLIGADTNVGKSSLVLRMAMGMDARDVPVSIISCEDNAAMFASRMVAVRSRVSSRFLMQRKAPPESHESIERAMSHWATRPLMFDHLPGGTDADVCMAMSRRVRQGARAVFVDYLQAIEPSDSQQDRRNAMRVVCSRIKATAHRLNVPLVVASQLRRPDAKAQTRPTKHDIKEAGDVSNAAESILLMWRDEEGDKAPVNVWLAKGKSGGVGLTDSFVRDQQSGMLMSQAEALKGRPFG